MTANHPYRIILALLDTAHIETWMNLAIRLAPPDGEIHLRGLVTIPADKSLSEGALLARTWRDTLTPISQAYALVQDEFRIHVDHQPMKRLLNELEDFPADLLIAQWMGAGMPTGGADTDEILERADCDLVLAGHDLQMQHGPVLLSLRGGPNLSLGLYVAKALADVSSITLFHATDQRRAAPDLEMIMRAEPQIQRTVTAASGIAEGILREAAGHQAIVMGATFHQAAAGSGKSGALVKRLQQETPTPLVLVRARRRETLEFHTPRQFIRIVDDL
ncbi:MAG: hypothetical protein K8I30_05520, partial [Anaerolineae bacterium]|nr:hypothetical protein [Anaerolineae bacterium]